jgi:hypothetical protein
VEPPARVDPPALARPPPPGLWGHRTKRRRRRRRRWRRARKRRRWKPESAKELPKPSVAPTDTYLLPGLASQPARYENPKGNNPTYRLCSSGGDSGRRRSLRRIRQTISRSRRHLALVWEELLARTLPSRCRGHNYHPARTGCFGRGRALIFGPPAANLDVGRLAGSAWSLPHRQWMWVATQHWAKRPWRRQRRRDQWWAGRRQ